MNRFEDLVAWQKARELTRLVYQITRQDGFRQDRGLASQMQRASVSIMSNVVEGFERSSQAEFSRYLAIAKASCGELRSQLYVALDIGYLEKSAFESILQRATEVSRLIAGLRKSVIERG